MTQRDRSMAALRSMALLVVMAVTMVVAAVGCAAPASIDNQVPASGPVLALAQVPVPATVIVGAPDPGFPPPDLQDPHRASTLHAVDTMLAATLVPPGAHRVNSSPTPAVDQILSSGGPTLIDAVQWWTASESRDQVLKFVRAHPPAHTTGVGSNDLATITTLMFSGTADPAYEWPQVGVSVSNLPNGRSAIRVDAQAVWVPSRTQAETISGDVSSVDVTLHFKGHTVNRTVVGQGAVGIGRALDALRPSAPVVVAGGSLQDTGFTDDLLFHGNAPDVAVTLTIDGPAAGAQIRVLGRAQPTLGGYGTTGPAPTTVDAAAMSALGLPPGYRK